MQLKKTRRNMEFEVIFVFILPWLFLYFCVSPFKFEFLVSLCRQSLGMSSDFTIKEIMYYFGSLHKMYRWKVKERIEYFEQMFDFPKGRVKIKRLE